MLWLLDFKAFPPWAPPSASQVKFRCPLDGGKTPTAIVSLIHSYTHTHLHILIKRDNIRINIKVNLAPTVLLCIFMGTQLVEMQKHRYQPCAYGSIKVCVCVCVYLCVSA